MKMNKPEMRVINFEVNDIVTNSLMDDPHYPAIDGQLVVYYPGKTKLYYESGSPIMWVRGDQIYVTFCNQVPDFEYGVYRVKDGTWTKVSGVPDGFQPIE